MGNLTIDINCDLGEGFSNDAALMAVISSANIACGYHAGDANTMRGTVDLAIDNGVAIGAHPGYPDLANFGRSPMKMSSAQVHEIVTDQIGVLAETARTAGGKIRHVKPHGALYNESARDAELAAAIAEAVRDIDSSLILFGLSGSRSIDEAKKLGLQTASEVFADRTYQTDGTLTPRTRPDALIEDTETALTQVIDMIKYGRVRSVDGIMIPIVAETVCIHGDGTNAVEFAREIRSILTKTDIAINALNG